MDFESDFPFCSIVFFSFFKDVQLPSKGTAPCSYSLPGRMQGGAGSPHSGRLQEAAVKIGRSFGQLSDHHYHDQHCHDHHHHNHQHRHVGRLTNLPSSARCADKAKDKKLVVPESSPETASPLGHHGVLVQRPASLDLLISLVNLVIRHSAPTLRSPGSCSGLEENNHLPGTDWQ